jgi:hypothetical protein
VDQDKKFLDTLTALTRESVYAADQVLPCMVAQVQHFLLTEVSDEGPLSCMPSAERIAAALVFCQLDAEKALSLLRNNGAGVMLHLSIRCLPLPAQTLVSSV